jgi:LemA protein
MEIAILVILGLVGLFLISAPYRWYVKVIKDKNNVQEASASVDVQLKKRYDLIPNILTIAQKFMDHERSLIEDITNLRTKALNTGVLQEKVNIDNELSGKMNQLFVNAENYPQLKSDSTMVQAMETYAEVEEHISSARRFYNSAVKELNNSIDIFPTSIIASMLYIRKYPYFEIAENEKKSLNASDYLK